MEQSKNNQINEKQFPELYKLATNGKISMWHAEVFEGHINIHHGYINGALQTETIEINSGKNIGRSNETSVFEQACAEAQSRWNKQKDKGYTEDESGITQMDVILPMLAQKYYDTKDSSGKVKKGRAKYIQFPCFVQPKLNGARCISYVKDDKRVYQSRLGKFWATLSHLDKELEPFNDVITDGEIYIHGMALQDILSLVKNGDLQNNINGVYARDLEYHIYDIVGEYEKFKDRLELRNRIFGLAERNGLNFKFIKRVPSYHCLDSKEVQQYYKICLEENYEGLMIRNANGLYQKNKRSNDLQKLKPHLDDEFEIVGGYEVETGRDRGTCVFTCKTEEGLLFDVRPKGSIAQRIEYYNRLQTLIGKKLTVEFQEWTVDKKPFHARGVAIRDYE